MGSERPSPVVAASVLVGSLVLFVPLTTLLTRVSVRTLLDAVGVVSLHLGVIGVPIGLSPIVLGFYVAGLVAEVRLLGYESIRSRPPWRSAIAHFVLLWLVVAGALAAGRVGVRFFQWGLDVDASWALVVGALLSLALGWAGVRGLRSFLRGYRGGV